MKVAFISCVSKKQNKKCKAEELYISDLFKKSLCYAKKNYEKIFILSAKYGLLSLEDIIEPYDMTLNCMKLKEQEQWSKNIMYSLKDKIKINDELTFLCGENYRKFLVKWLPHNKKIPLKGLSIGRQLSFYKEHLK